VPSQAGAHIRVTGSRCLQNATEVRPMMSLLLALHKVAAQRGDRLRPELLRLLENSKAEKGSR
jgi:hypothetical protein